MACLARIMLVDDEDDIRNIFERGLEQAGFEVQSFRDPREALSHFQAGQHDILILDVRMPKMDGFTLYERMREIDGHVKVCFLTAFDVEYREEFRKKFPNLDTKCFMKKPISLMTIIRIVK
jgi:DNA-binding response OmpR family regulator